MDFLAQIDAPHYCAGMVIIGDKIVEAAPIIKWAIGKNYNEVFDYFRRKKYGIKVHDEERGWVTMTRLRRE